METTTIDTHDADTAAELLALHRAAHDADQPDNPGPCGVAFPVNLRHPRPGADIVHRVVRRDGVIVGHAEVYLPTMDNLHFAGAEITVHPGHRRRGIGRALFEAAVAIAEGAGRRSLSIGTIAGWEDGPARSEAGRHFLTAMGASLALTEVHRRAPVDYLDPAEEERMTAEALAASEGYETIAWTGVMPRELLEPVARLDSTFLAEAPIGELDLEPEKIDEQRMRDNQEATLARGIFCCGVVARPIGSTEIVANTVIGVKTEPGDVADQWITLVSPKHRGHKLGMRVKLENHRQLRAARPEVKTVGTGNADVNAHMIAINEALGFRTVDAWYEYQITLPRG
ncbi:acetyltransferase (GNAT) family protein [Stackebrandtia albiflava]|uniref:Acetyltransferase (GNAT) family protein n=1 Tax=Stackebrandtia albiflava TaxID=406432 RepID=A0A562UYG1_9ACTN|nr:GNAT family N-acetyltransferase [Stackebrandtia albiflava]TWJ10659.1 acetyltransferase (GNAT) family protein [Stackebrandtia albiflava]